MVFLFFFLRVFTIYGTIYRGRPTGVRARVRTIKNVYRTINIIIKNIRAHACTRRTFVYGRLRLSPLGFPFSLAEPVMRVSWRLPSDYNVAIVTPVWRRRRRCGRYRPPPKNTLTDILYRTLYFMVYHTLLYLIPYYVRTFFQRRRRSIDFLSAGQSSARRCVRRWRCLFFFFGRFKYINLFIFFYIFFPSLRSSYFFPLSLLSLPPRLTRWSFRTSMVW